MCHSVGLSVCLSVSLSLCLPLSPSARPRAYVPAGLSVRHTMKRVACLTSQRVACLTSVSGVGRQNDIQLRCAKCGDEAFWSNGQWDGRTRFHATASHIVRGIVLGWLLPTPPPSCGRARSSPPTVVCLFIGLSVCLSVLVCYGNRMQSAQFSSLHGFAMSIGVSLPGMGNEVLISSGSNI